MVIPWLLNRNGQGISVKAEWKGKVGADPKALKPFVDAAKAAGTPLTFAMTFPPGTHAMWMRYYLGNAGVNPDKDVTLIVVPPAQMVQNMKIGKMDGFCVGEPWNARVIADGIGYTSVTTQDIWKDHPEKVCAFMENSRKKIPRRSRPSSRRSTKPASGSTISKTARSNARSSPAPTYINCPKELILGRLLGHYDYGDGRKKEDENYMIFSKRNCNYPQAKYANWFLSQYRRWGMVTGAPDYEGVAKRVMRADIYEEAMKEIGYATAARTTIPKPSSTATPSTPPNPKNTPIPSTSKTSKDNHAPRTANLPMCHQTGLPRRVLNKRLDHLNTQRYPPRSRHEKK